MIFENYKDPFSINYDVLIAGSGPAGISLALELEKKNIKSLIIEAGNYEYSEESQNFYKGSYNSNIISDISTSRIRQFGGTSNIWGGWCKPLNKLDYDSWNFNHEELNKFENSSCEILDIKNLFRESKIDKNFNQIEFQYSKVNFAKKYNDHFVQSKNITVFLNTQLTHFIGSNGKILFAKCINNKEVIDLKAKHFVLCCGGIENSRIMLWTKENNKNLLSKYLPLGKFWMIHHWTIAGVGLLDKEKFKNYMGSNFLDYDGPIHIGSTSKSKNVEKPLDAAAYLTPKEDTKFIKEVVKDILCVAPEFGKKIARLILNKSLKCGNVFMHLESEAKKENNIELDFLKKDKNNIPRVKINYQISTSEKESAKKFFEDLAVIFQKNDLGRLGMNKEIFNNKDFDNLGTFHHMGGTRIGKSTLDSVVDENLKVHNIKNLFISGSSVFRKSGYKNPTFTIVQLSLRLANRIKTMI